jgi:hypothetical protein
MSNKFVIVFAQKKKVLLTVFLIMVAAILPIFEETVVPEWKIQFVDENGKAVQNQRVQQTWKDYSTQWLSSMDGESIIMTDMDGYVVLPERSIRVSLFDFLAGWLWEVSPRINPHTGYGKSSFVLCRDKADCNASYREGKALPNRVVVTF